ncbi:MAG: DUF3221 domain-containing protein [Firmicutes bacterium]|nr:DUF3221 domain-containing protein [Bacillota bacterium]
MKKVVILFVLTLLMMAVVGCSNSEELSGPSGKDNLNSATDSQFVEYGVAGYITDITVSEKETILGTIKVEGSKDNGAIYDKAVVTVTPTTKINIDNFTDFNALEVGMYVNIFFDGSVRESYPVQADAKQINVIPKDENDKDTDKTE